MVFSGKPSTACHACRARRLKCDRGQPSCGQCLRKGEYCGYRDTNALRLRNETGRVTTKYAKHHSALATPSPASSPEGTPPPPFLPPPATEITAKREGNQYRHVASPVVRVPAPGPRQPEELLSMAYFMSSYIVATPFETYLPHLCEPNIRKDDAFTAALSATALAAYAHRIRSPQNMNTARRWYSTALAYTNTALAQDVTSVSDRTIAAVLLLGFFEAVVFQGGESSSPKSWTTHTFGALELFRLRGVESLKSPISQRIFGQASNNVRTSCIQMSQEIPPKLLRFCEEATPLLDPRNMSFKLSPLIHKVARIKAQSKNNPPTYSMLLEARRMDQSLVLFAGALPKELSYYTLPKAETPSWAFNGLAHGYYDIRAAKVWNAIRLLRIFLVTYIGAAVAGELNVEREELAAGAGLRSNDGHLVELAQYATDQMTDIAAQIMACVPAFVHANEQSRMFSPAARSLVWPLCVIEHVKICPKPYRAYASRCVQDIAGDLNLPQALDAALNPQKYEDWMHLFHLG